MSLADLSVAQWRFDNVWSRILDCPTMCFLYDHVGQVMDLPLIFNKNDTIVIGHGAPAGTKVSAQRMLKANCMFGMDMIFNELNKLPIATLDPEKKMPFDMKSLCELWRNRSKSGPWATVMALCREDNFPVISRVPDPARSNNGGNNGADVDDEEPDRN